MTVGITELPPEGMQLGGVALAGDAERGTKTTEGLSLLFTTAGITVQGPQPQIERLLVWSGLDSASCREKVVLPDGRNAAVMELTSGGQSIRFLFPTESVTPGQAAYLDQALPHWLARYKGAPPAPAPTNGAGGVQAAPPAAPAGNGSAPPPPPPPPASADQPSHVAPAAAAGAAAAVAGGVAAAASTPPSPPVAGAPSAPTAPPPPPAPPSPYQAGPSFTPPPAADPAAGAWVTAPDPGADTSAWAGPPSGPVGDADIPPPSRKSSRRRKNKTPEAAVAPVSYQAQPDPSQPPFAPPNDPVRLEQSSTLPPPPAATPGYPGDPGAGVWSPPVDPVTGQPNWDGQPAAGAASPELAPTTKRAKRKADKAAKAAALGGAAAVGAAGAEAAMVGAPPSPVDTGFGTPQQSAPYTAPFDPTAATPPPGEPGAAYGVQAPEDQPRKRNNRLMVLLLVALVVVIAAIGVIYVKRHNDTTTTPPTAPVLPVTTADTALAASVNLHQNDLPTGWTPSTATGQPARPPVAPAAAQSQATRALAQCLGSTTPVVSALFDGTPAPGQTGTATSPSFQSPTDPTIQMHSVTRVLSSAAQAQALQVPFTNASFVACYTAYQSSVASAAVPGATATVQSVSLAAPSGVQSFGYLTTFTIPNQGSEVVGQAFIIGGRIQSTLEPTTGGAAVPTDAFTSAYNAISGRIGLDVSK